MIHDLDHGNLRGPPQGQALLRDYENPLVSLNKALFIRAGYSLGRKNVALGPGVPLDCLGTSSNMAF